MSNIYSSYLHTHLLLKVGRHNNKSQILKVGIGIMKNDQFCFREYLNIYTIFVILWGKSSILIDNSRSLEY